MADFTLYCFAQSGNAYKAALMLNLCGADWRPRFVDYFNGETRTPEFRRINPMGEVPVLQHGTRRLSQSAVILDYLAQHFGKFGWSNDDERREILRWLLFDNHKLTSYTATLRFMLALAKTGETEVTAFLRQRSRTALGIRTTTWRRTTSRSVRVRPLPTSRCAATCSGRGMKSASAGPTSSGTSGAGWSGSRRCPAACIPTS